MTASGSFRAKVYRESVNYKDANGQWQPIDDALRPDASSPYRYENAANRYSLKLPMRLGTAPVRIEQGSVGAA